MENQKTNVEDIGLEEIRAIRGQMKDAKEKTTRTDAELDELAARQAQHAVL
ncbi:MULTISPECIES: hypothetical protein [unclassified Synechococcus]|uniref:hypothetical protein n=1 Tax=unclassified Synechococcus TaxID=2626047 RepID=UPI000AF51F85|nr:hypothetical protein [Synechococcus sp. WH 8020]